MDKIIINELVNGIQSIYNDALSSIVLYGSAARGAETDESDIDIAIIIDGSNDKVTNEKLVDFAVELDLKYDKVFSIIEIEYDNYKKWENVLPFYRNVKEEGVILWISRNAPSYPTL